MKLFLTSYIAGTKSLLKDFLREYDKKNILFIPTAGDVEEYTGYIDEGIEAIRKLGYTIDLLDIANKKREDIVPDIASCGCLCISGGNTFYLLQELKRKHLIEIIASKISQGMLYIGESAGAIIASKNIEYNQIMDNKTVARDLTDYSGMGIFDKFVLPHYGEFPFEETAEKTMRVYSPSLELIPINNHQAIVVEDNQYTIMG